MISRSNNIHPTVDPDESSGRLPQAEESPGHVIVESTVNRLHQSESVERLHRAGVHSIGDDAKAGKKIRRKNITIEEVTQ